MLKYFCVLLLLLASACTTKVEQEAFEEVIAELGGTVTSSDGKMTITIKPNALDEDCVITITLTDDGNYSIEPRDKALKLAAEMDYDDDAPLEEANGWLVRPRLFSIDDELIDGNYIADTQSLRFRGTIGEFGEIQIRDSYFDFFFDLKSTEPRTARGRCDIHSRALPSGEGPRLSAIAVDYLINGRSEVSQPPDIDDTPGSSTTGWADFLNMPSGRFPGTARVTARYDSPTFAGFSMSVEWGQEIDIVALTEAALVQFEQGSAPEAAYLGCHLPNFAWTDPSDELVAVGFGDGGGLFNYSTGQTLGNGTSNFFYTHAFDMYGFCPGRFDPNLTSQLQQTAPVVDIMLGIGAGGAQIQYWDDTAMDFGAPVVLETVNTTDAAAYAGDATSGGFTYASDVGNFVKFLEFDTNSSTFVVDAAKTITDAQLPNASGAIVSAFRPDTGGEVLIVTDGDPGQLWVKTPGQAGNATLIGDVGSGVRRVRALNGVGVVSAFGSGLGFGSLTFITKQSGSWAFGPFGLVGQRSIGVDLKALGNGNVAVASTAFLNDAYRVTVLAPDASIVSEESFDLPEGAEGPGHIIWLPDGGLLVSCNTTNNLVIVPPVVFP